MDNDSNHERALPHDAPEGTIADPQSAWDRERARCPVTGNDTGALEVLGHPETLAVLQDHETFSNEVSAHLSVPNGMDPPEHGPYRAIVERYFNQEAMDSFEPTCRAIAVELIEPWIDRGGALRVRGPLVANRRVATRDIELAGRAIRKGDRLRLLWPAANLDSPKGGFERVPVRIEPSCPA